MGLGFGLSSMVNKGEHQNDRLEQPEQDGEECCLQLLKKYGVLLCPASVCFGDAASGDFQGYVCVWVLPLTL